MFAVKNVIVEKQGYKKFTRVLYRRDQDKIHVQDKIRINLQSLQRIAQEYSHFLDIKVRSEGAVAQVGILVVGLVLFGVLREASLLVGDNAGITNVTS